MFRPSKRETTENINDDGLPHRDILIVEVNYALLMLGCIASTSQIYEFLCAEFNRHRKNYPGWYELHDDGQTRGYKAVTWVLSDSRQGMVAIDSVSYHFGKWHLNPPQTTVVEKF